MAFSIMLTDDERMLAESYANDREFKKLPGTIV